MRVWAVAGAGWQGRSEGVGPRAHDYVIASDTTYLRLTDGCGHTPESYAPWLTATLEAALLDPKRSEQARGV